MCQLTDELEAECAKALNEPYWRGVNDGLRLAVSILNRSRAGLGREAYVHAVEGAAFDVEEARIAAILVDEGPADSHCVKLARSFCEHVRGGAPEVSWLFEDPARPRVGDWAYGTSNLGLPDSITKKPAATKLVDSLTSS